MPWLGFALQDSSTPYRELALIAAVCGIGSANGLNGGPGNLGVSVVHLVAPLVVAGAGLGAPVGGPQRDTTDNEGVCLQNSAFLWVPFRRKRNWLTTWLYVGTIESFTGCAAAPPLLIKNSSVPQGYQATTYVRSGPLVDAPTAWADGWMRDGDKIGGARVTTAPFVGMAASLIVIKALPSGSEQGTFRPFHIGCPCAFAFSGVGSGPTLRQIPVIFRDQHLKKVRSQGEQVEQVGQTAPKQAETESGAVTGFTAGIAAYGFFTCLVVCWSYARKGAETLS